MATVTAQALIAAGLRRADMVDSPTAFIAHPTSGGGEAFDILNAALSELFDILYEADPSAYSETKIVLPTVANTATYVLQTIASNLFYRLRGMEWFDGVRNRNLGRVAFANRNDFPLSGPPAGYSIEGDNLVIYPTPNNVYTLGVHYQALPPTASADADTFDLKGPWAEFVQIHFAIQCLEKEESDTASLGSRLGGLAARIRNAAKRRDSANPVQVIDVQGGSDFMLGGFAGPYGGRYY